MESTNEQNFRTLKSLRQQSMRNASVLTSERKNKRVKINVGGEVHEPFIGTLRNVPDSPLAWILDENIKRVLDCETENGELFFDRHPAMFAQVLDYFQTGKLHYPRNVCGPMFEEELRFWGIEEQQMECCCWHDYTRHRVAQESLKIFDPQRTETSSSMVDIELGQISEESDSNERSSRWHVTKNRVWQLLDQPSSSSASKLFAWASLGFIILSVISFTVYTMDHIHRVQISNCTESINATGINASKGITKCFNESKTNMWAVVASIETFCLGWFTLEIVLRTIFCPNMLQYLTSLSTILDVLPIITSFILLLSSRTGSDWIGIINMTRFFRISRFFRLIYSLQVLGRSLKASAYHFLTLLILLTIPVIFFSSFIFYTEKWWGTEKSKMAMASIPHSFWWAVVTMTTVGYGDAVPDSIPGFFVGGAAAVLGVIILSLTSSIIGSTFQQYYNLAQTQLKIPHNRQNQVHVPSESLHEMAGFPPKDISKSSINSGNSKSSGRDSGYGKSPITKKKVRSGSHPPESKKNHRATKRGSLELDLK